MSINNNVIPVSAGAGLTQRFQVDKENILAVPYKNNGTLPVCETFNTSGFASFIAMENCTGIRVYCGMDSEFKVRLVICGVDSDNQDIYLQPDPAKLEFYVIENGVRCPESCPPTSELNR